MSAEHDLQQLRRAIEHGHNSGGLKAIADEGLAALSRVGERIDAQQKALEARSAQDAETRTLRERLARAEDRAVCDGCGADVAESGECLGECGDGEMIPASDLPGALREMRQQKDNAYEYLAEAEGLTEAAEARVAALTEALRRIEGLLVERSLWNDNVWYARQLAGDALADFRRSVPESATKPEPRGPVSGAGGNTADEQLLGGSEAARSGGES